MLKRRKQPERRGVLGVGGDGFWIDSAGRTSGFDDG